MKGVVAMAMEAEKTVEAVREREAAERAGVGLVAAVMAEALVMKGGRGLTNNFLPSSCQCTLFRTLPMNNGARNTSWN